MEERLFKRSKFIKDNSVNEEQEDQFEANIEKEQLKLSEKVTDVQDKVYELQSLMAKNLSLCHNADADSVILSAIEEAKYQDYEEFELIDEGTQSKPKFVKVNNEFDIIETSEFGGDEYKTFEERSKKQLQNNMGKSQYALLDGSILFKSRYFGTVTSHEEPSIKSSIDAKVPDSRKTNENEELKIETRNTKSKNSILMSSDASSSDQDDDNYEEMTIFYPLEGRRTKENEVLSNTQFYKNMHSRRHSAEGNNSEINNFLLQTSVAQDKLDVNIFSELKWREIHGLIIHKAMICK